MDLNTIFEVCAGTTIGARHIEEGRNNQDFFIHNESPDCFIGVVCDGCGEQPYSEVGANLIGRKVLNILENCNYAGTVVSHYNYLTSLLENRLWGMLYDIFPQIVDDKKRKSFIYDSLLTTIIAYVVTEDYVRIFAFGDGSYVINGNAVKLGPFPNNRPPYFAYRLDKKIPLMNGNYVEFSTREIQSLIIGTDGTDRLEQGKTHSIFNQILRTDFDQFIENDDYYDNPFMVSRNLRMLAAEKVRIVNGEMKKVLPLLNDDTTLIAMRRKKIETS